MAKQDGSGLYFASNASNMVGGMAGAAGGPGGAVAGAFFSLLGHQLEQDAKTKQAIYTEKQARIQRQSEKSKMQNLKFGSMNRVAASTEEMGMMFNPTEATGSTEGLWTGVSETVGSNAYGITSDKKTGAGIGRGLRFSVGGYVNGGDPPLASGITVGRNVPTLPPGYTYRSQEVPIWARAANAATWDLVSGGVFGSAIDATEAARHVSNGNHRDALVSAGSSFLPFVDAAVVNELASPILDMLGIQKDQSKALYEYAKNGEPMLKIPREHIGDYLKRKGFAVGGYTEKGGHKEIPAILHPGEIVIPADKVAHAGGGDWEQGKKKIMSFFRIPDRDGSSFLAGGSVGSSIGAQQGQGGGEGLGGSIVESIKKLFQTMNKKNQAEQTPSNKYRNLTEEEAMELEELLQTRTPEGVMGSGNEDRIRELLAIENQFQPSWNPASYDYEKDGRAGFSGGNGTGEMERILFARPSESSPLSWNQGNYKTVPRIDRMPFSMPITDRNGLPVPQETDNGFQPLGESGSLSSSAKQVFDPSSGQMPAEQPAEKNKDGKPGEEEEDIERDYLKPLFYGGVAQTIIGALGTMERRPKYAENAELNSFKDEARKMAATGYTPAEWSNAMRLIRQKIAASGAMMKNVSQSAGQYMNRAGALADKVMNEVSANVARDAALRRENIDRYSRVLNIVERRNRERFEDDLRAWMQKQQAAGSMMKAGITNMAGYASVKDREQSTNKMIKMYGGKYYEKWMEQQGKASK